MEGRISDSAGRIATMGRHNVRLLVADRAAIVILLAMPLVVMGFLRPTYRATLRSLGYGHASGAEQAVPGVTVMFAFLWIGFLAYTFFLEHQWRTLTRVRASGASIVELLVGKTLPGLALIVAQIALLLGVGSVAYGADVRGSLWGLALLAATLAACVVGLTLALVALGGSFQQVNAVGSLTAVVLAGVGGALSPPGTLPGALNAISPGSPCYWAIRGLRSVILDGASAGDVSGDAAMLLAFAAAGLAVAAVRMRLRGSLVG